MPNEPGDLNFMNGVPELLMLQLLSKREMYGYELVREIATTTGQVVVVGEGGVYPILHAMERKRWVTANRRPLGGRTRIYYRLTDAGRRQLAESAGRWTRLAEAIADVLSNGKPGVAHG